MSVGLFIMLAVTAVLDCKGLIREVKPRLDQIMSARRVEEMVDAVNQSQDQSFILLDEEYTILASSFPQVRIVSHFPIHFQSINSKTYMSLSNRVDLPGGQRVYIQTFFDVAFHLKKLIVLGLSGLLIFAVSLTVIYFRGHVVTRKSFGSLTR